MAFRIHMLMSIPPGAADRWVNAQCDCGHKPDHTNDYRLIGEWLCMAAADEDGVIYKWQILFLEDGSQFASGFGHTIQECYSQAEMSAKALVTDRAAYFEKNPDRQAPMQ